MLESINITEKTDDFRFYLLEVTLTSDMQNILNKTISLSLQV